MHGVLILLTSSSIPINIQIIAEFQVECCIWQAKWFYFYIDSSYSLFSKEEIREENSKHELDYLRPLIIKLHSSPITFRIKASLIAVTFETFTDLVLTSSRPHLLLPSLNSVTLASLTDLKKNMNQALYAHMNNKRKKKSKIRTSFKNKNF
jgi:hypothetical protein